ncbi:succinate dehydrogenase flavoprotein subunit [Cronobacter sakazakii]|uniref:Succinate dehydrogenase flavoprotein subunit n=1 Tax=Cronobacter sakazakii TaxID=28141 RepID=A0AA44Z6L1_CROSK|nr:MULTISPECIES: succinate dehydrogenase flavoprotein subunit [Cronobacter]EKM0439554.1 succinate dehydrogenase flavoprotein subunit [Cronobacter turicensis]EKS1073423.1 succinate dehydrogenase flavoprotein subunit [Cronobacter sakazakii]EKS1087101.1 succinate dehydrogenase flavoprotein subunit [Cronobacter sakazakii]ELQ5973777.1 succinate dehydrogenase flavoprotein subunit [Cronobacter sakazakii]ELQ6034797.1 succinate dehydrogenase flavoprotein subunit [Cronobacter sakazakii]
MQFDPQIVAQAKAFVNAFREGKRAHVPPLRFEFWQQFMTTVRAELEAKA